MPTSTPAWLASAVGTFGGDCFDKLGGPGDPEAAIRTPLEILLRAVGEHLNVHAVFHDEVRDTERAVRPDYGVSVAGAITGYIEVKAPGVPIDPATFTGHNKRQWDRQKDLPNLIYTNGGAWRLYRDGEQIGDEIAFAGGSLRDAGTRLTSPPEFETLIIDFLKWKPAPITSVAALVRAVAPLTRLLRGEVLDTIAQERAAVIAGADAHDQPFLGLEGDWRQLLFPQADDQVFADGYAQTVTFALLLARSEDIDFAGRGLHEVGDLLGAEHSLMGKALQLLTDDAAADFRVTLDLLVRVIGAVNWDRIRAGSRDTYLYLYERFLEHYDPALRRKSGSYYTPRDVVDAMVRLTRDVLTGHLGKAEAFADSTVLTVDPAMGTGTFLHSIIEQSAESAAQLNGPGMVAPTITELVTRLVGFELQTGPYAVAELRASDLIRATRAALPRGGLRFYVTNTLDDPHAEHTQISSSLWAISDSRRKADQVKAEDNVTVVIGNPPYAERAEGQGGWIEQGSQSAAHSLASGGGHYVPLDDFRAAGNGRFEHNMKNMWTYFWRWATWKTWTSTPDAQGGDTGVVCFITPSAYLDGVSYKGMRQYLRRVASHGWVINLTPEGQTPGIATRAFPHVRQPLCIGIFVRTKGTDADAPAQILYRSVHGTQAEKFEALANISLGGSGWRAARTESQAAFMPAADSTWDDFPALGDILPWTSPGVTGNRRWPYAAAASILADRWATLMNASGERERETLFKVTRDRNMSRVVTPLPGSDTGQRRIPLNEDTGPMPAPVRIGYRAFDRQWIIPDSRVLDMPRPDLWAARGPTQVYVVELHTEAVQPGPGVVFTSIIPELHYFKGRGGRALPLRHPDGSPNLAPGLTEALSALVGLPVTGEAVLAYVAGTVSHPAYTQRFADELTTPGIRVPITGDAELWVRAVELGRQVIWLHSYGATYVDPADGRPANNVRYPDGDPRQPLVLTSPTAMPETISYDRSTAALRLGDGEWGPVTPAAFNYTVGGKNIIRSWFNYRKETPGGRKTSPLDQIHVEEWPGEWSVELLELLTVLARLTEMENQQADLLRQILEAPLASSDELASAGVAWPTTRADRAARHRAHSDDAAGQLDLS